VRAQFVLSEIGIGLRRNLTMTIAVVVTVAISLALFGSGLLIRKQVETMKDFWYDKVEVSVYLCGAVSDSPTCEGQAVTDDQRAELEADLRAMPRSTRSSTSRSRTPTSSSRSSSPTRRTSSRTSPPTSCRSRSGSSSTTRRSSRSSPRPSSDRPGVEEVQDQKALLEGFFDLLNRLQLLALIIAGVQVVAAVLLISNTIRVAAFSRRRETGIMRLVGASNLYIQLPFLLEGVLAGIVGAAFATGALAAVKVLLIDGQLRPTFTFTAFIGWDDVLATVPWLFLTGVLLAGLSSFVTLRRHLRV
jgi:cell division transport system permease protein